MSVYVDLDGERVRATVTAVDDDGRYAFSSPFGGGTGSLLPLYDESGALLPPTAAKALCDREKALTIYNTLREAGAFDSLTEARETLMRLLEALESVPILCEAVRKARKST